jgi:hypothetical protein
MDNIVIESLFSASIMTLTVFLPFILLQRIR